jgi:two-component system sensor histidine kinase ChvG
VRARHPEVLLFVTEPIRIDGDVPAVVYVTRSTQPVLVELYRIRTGLVRVLAVAFVFCFVVTLALAWSISRPLSKLSRAASRIAHGERDVPVPVGGSGEVRELGEAFFAMASKLDARAQSMRDFAADVAHEFKSPLTSIRGAAELLREAAADDPPARDRFLNNIELDAERLDRLVTRLLELSRLDASTDTMTTVDLETLVRRVAERASDGMVSVTLDYRASKRLVRARAPDLERAIQNVVDNAVRFSRAGAVVAIRVDDNMHRPGGARALVVSVSDEGPGIAPENLGRIFDRFFTTDADRNGTGLGLAIVRTVMDAHGGRVWAESALGSGTTVHLEVPVA